MSRTEPDHLRLFLVEDSPADTFLVKEAMREEGLSCDFQVAVDGQRAIELFDRMDAQNGARPNLLLLDLNVPRRTGDQVLQRVKTSPEWANIPVVVISSSYSDQDRQMALDLGADEYFRKPSNLKEFMELGKVVRRLSQKTRDTID